MKKISILLISLLLTISCHMSFAQRHTLSRQLQQSLNSTFDSASTDNASLKSNELAIVYGGADIKNSPHTIHPLA